MSIVAFSATDATTISTYDGLPDGTIDTYRAATVAAGTPLIATIFDDSPSGTMAAILAAMAAETSDALAESLRTAKRRAALLTTRAHEARGVLGYVLFLLRHLQLRVVDALQRKRRQELIESRADGPMRGPAQGRRHAALSRCRRAVAFQSMCRSGSPGT